MMHRDELLAQADAQLREGMFEAAVEAYTTVLQDVPGEARALRGRALAHFQLKRWGDAREDFARARERNPADVDNWVGLGMSLAMAHHIYEAIAVFEGLLTRHPDYVRGHLQLGVLYYRLCATAKGRAQLECALACRPTLAERRMIETVLKEQQVLDQRRYYRPDFEALRRAKAHPQPVC